MEAAHIKSWAEAPGHRFDVRNGLCLSVLHHQAFDEGLITLDENLALMVSPRLRGQLSQPALEANFLRY